MSEVVPVAHDLVHLWGYGSERSELRQLHEKSKRLQWNATDDIAWDTNVDPESELIPDAFNPLFGTEVWSKLEQKRELPSLRRHMTSYVVSNFLHGEHGALMATSQIVACESNADAKLLAAVQVADEARHVEAYDRYLREKIELVYPVSPHLKQLLNAIVQDSRPDFKYLGMQILVEGLALGAFGVIHQSANDPLITQITRMVMQDEARHVAFGVLSLKDRYVDMTENELRDREDFVVDSCRLLHDRFLAQEVWQHCGLPQAECEDAAANSPMMAMFRKLLFSKIVPNVKRLGLLTARVRRSFEELGIVEYESWEPSA